MKNAVNGMVTKEKRDKLFNFRPALFAAFFLLLGIVFAYRQTVYNTSAWWLFCLLPVPIVTLAFSENKRHLKKRSLALLFLFVCFFLGVFSFRLQYESFAKLPAVSGEATVFGTVCERKVGEKGVSVQIEDISIDGKEVDGKLIAYLPRSLSKNLRIADRIILRGNIQKIKAYGEGDPFRATEVGEKIGYRLYGEEYSVVGQSNNLFLRIRARVEKSLCAGMDETPAAVTLALLTGDTSGIEEGFLQNVRYGGIAHIFAVSGLHVGALYAFCLLLFSKTPMRRMPKAARFVMLLSILLFYGGICGFSASVRRATVLCVVSYFFKLLLTGSDALNTLGVAAIVILLPTPSALFEVGFQLSFLASLGIVLLSRRIGQVCDEIHKRLRKRFPKRLSVEEREAVEKGDTLPLGVGGWLYQNARSLFSASLAAQITTAPVLLMQFGYLSGWSLLLNFFFVPFVSGVFAFLLVGVALSCALPLAWSGILLYLPSVLWSAALLLFEIVDFSSFMLTGVQLSAANCVCYYGGVCLLTDKWNLSDKMRRWLALLFFAGFLAGVCFFNA